MKLIFINIYKIFIENKIIYCLYILFIFIIEKKYSIN